MGLRQFNGCVFEAPKGIEQFAGGGEDHPPEVPLEQILSHLPNQKSGGTRVESCQIADFYDLPAGDSKASLSVVALF